MIGADEWRRRRRSAQATRDAARPRAARPLRPAAAGARRHLCRPRCSFAIRASACRFAAARVRATRGCSSSTRPTSPAAPDGRWWVLADRCEVASGAGFALENRIAMSRMLPDVFRAMPRRAARAVFHRRQGAARPARARSTRRAAHRAAQPGRRQHQLLRRRIPRSLPRLHARRSGRPGRAPQRLYLKTLAGLSPVNVLFRRPNSEHLDPLEIADASRAGIAGLLQSPRSGNVAIANSPGSGLVESPVFMAFLPRFAEALLGEPLLMPGVATWWCGEPKSRSLRARAAGRARRSCPPIAAAASRVRNQPAGRNVRERTGRADRSRPGSLRRPRADRPLHGAGRGPATSFSRRTSRCARSPSRKKTTTW